MTTNKKCLLVAACAAAASIVAVVSWAGADKPAKDRSAANTKTEAKILSVLEDMSNDRRYAMKKAGCCGSSQRQQTPSTLLRSAPQMDTRHCGFAWLCGPQAVS